MKELIRQKNLLMWKEVVEKVNVNFEGVGKNFGLLLVGEQGLGTEVLLS